MRKKNIKLFGKILNILERQQNDLNVLTRRLLDDKPKTQADIIITNLNNELDNKKKGSDYFI